MPETDKTTNSARDESKEDRTPKANNFAIRILAAAQTFTADAEALQEVLDVAKPVLIAKQKERQDELDQLKRLKRAEVGDHNTPLNFMEMDRLIGLFAKQRRGGFLFRGHLLVALVSRFDGFISQVGRELLLFQPARLEKRSVSFSDAVEYGSIEELKQKLIEDEIEQQMRGSHSEQLEFVSSLANVKLAGDERELFSNFIELTERRNCHIHTSGTVSPQYRRVCATHGVNFPREYHDGDRLNVNVHYFANARQVLSEMAFKIAQTIVRKVFPDSTNLADTFANVRGLQMLNQHRWKEALVIFEYAAKLRDSWIGNESVRKSNIINRAQALIGLGKNAEALKSVQDVDWTASHPKYIMAIHLLKEEFPEAAALMPLAEFSEEDYRDLPIFEKFRETAVFRNAFLGLFGHDFEQMALDALSEAIEKIEKGDGVIMPPNGTHGDAESLKPNSN